MNDWLTLCRALGVPDEAGRAAFARLSEAYASPGRVYHTLEHVRQVLATLAPLRDQARTFAELQLAAWFHDAVYDSQAKDNEERSADLAANVLGELGGSAELIAEVRRLILLTRTHDPAETDTDGCLLVDADLAILGAAPDEYAKYAAAIRQEYAWVPEEAYRSGRRAVLESFLRRPRIFRTMALGKLEEQARRNVAAEAQSLS
jgi:predicted metal-dependent HD superfamily phosphohydrolase